MIRVLLIVFMMISGVCEAAYYCGSYDMNFADESQCNSVCTDPCSLLEPAPSSGSCSAQYTNYIYDSRTGMTYGVSTAKELWTAGEQFIADSERKGEIATALAKISGKTLWLGLYDASTSAAYGSVNKSNFVWSDGGQLSYDNFADGQPDNNIDAADIGVVSIYGEHWVYTGTDGKWYDDGQHASYGGDYQPRHYHIESFGGMLSCVAGTAKPDVSEPVEVKDAYCQDNSGLCSLCVYNDTIDQCTNGTDISGAYAGLCPAGVVSCDMDFSPPECPSGTVYSSEYKKCTAAAVKCPAGYTLSGNKCVREPRCINGSYNPVTNRCEASAYTECISGTIFNSGWDLCYVPGLNISKSGYITGIYQLVLGREPDIGGYQYWAREFSSPPLQWNIEAFINGARLNGQRTCGRYISAGDEVELMTLYVWYFGRCPDSGGYNYWLSTGFTDSVFKEAAIPECQRIGGCPDPPLLQNTCPEGLDYNAVHKTCVTNPYVYCPSGMSQSGGVCINSVICPSGGSLNAALDRCELNVLNDCPSGTSYSSSLNLCISQPDCAVGSKFTPLADSCVEGACPYGANIPCVNIATASAPDYKCSPHACLDPNDPSYSDNSYDTGEGENDKLNNGSTGDDGKCLDQIYFFNGSDRRCRPPGTQTGFSNCCTKDETWFGIGKCSPGEQALSALRDWGELDGQCHYVGEYCAEKWGMCPACVCVQKKKTYCCFGSPLGRIAAEQGREQLGFGFGTAKSPECRGFTPEEFQKLDFSKIDFTEWLETYVTPEMMPNVEGSIVNTFENIRLPEINP
jgi:hypothetical protein